MNENEYHGPDGELFNLCVLLTYGKGEMNENE